MKGLNSTRDRDRMTSSRAIGDLTSQRKLRRTGLIESFINWALKVPEPKAGKLNFDKFPFQRELYSQDGAMHPEIAVKKATQIGISTWLLRWVLFHCDVGGLTALYLFPKRQQMYDFSDARIKAAIEGSTYLAKRIPPGHIANKGLKRIGTGFLYARGSESKDDLQSVDADSLAMDEYDDLRQENVPDAERRLSGSEQPRIRRVGVPSLPNHGIDRIYQESDQRKWVTKCPRCGLRQPLTYEDNVDESEVAIVCRGWKEDRRAEGLSCRAPLDVRHGEWVAKYPDRPRRGYHMPRLIVAHTNLQSIVDAHQATNPTEITIHQTHDLAEAYAAEEGRLSDEAIEAATRDDLPPDAGQPYEEGRLITMGLDTAGARNLHCRISEHVSDDLKLPLFVGEVDSFPRAKALVERFGVNMVVVDHLPEGRLAMQLAETFPGRVYLVHFADLKGGVLEVKPELRKVAVRRTELIDATFDRIRMQRTLLPNADQVDPTYKEHLQVLHRVTGIDAKGRRFASYEGNGDFDFAMAEAYDQLAAIVWKWQRDVTNAIQGEEVPFEEMYEWEPEQLDRGTADRGGIDEYVPGEFGE